MYINDQYFLIHKARIQELRDQAERERLIRQAKNHQNISRFSTILQSLKAFISTQNQKSAPAQPCCELCCQP